MPKLIENNLHFGYSPENTSLFLTACWEYPIGNDSVDLDIMKHIIESDSQRVLYIQKILSEKKPLINAKLLEQEKAFTETTVT